MVSQGKGCTEFVTGYRVGVALAGICVTLSLGCGLKRGEGEYEAPRPMAAGSGGKSAKPADIPTSLRRDASAVPGPADGGLADHQIQNSAAPPQGPVMISEVMYHPVLEDAVDDPHEFVEFGNRSNAAVSIAGWRLDGPIGYVSTRLSMTTLFEGEPIMISEGRIALLGSARYGTRSPESRLSARGCALTGE